MLRRIAAAVLLTAGLSGCWLLPQAHRIDVNQGNVIEQSDVERLEIGMRKNQVRFLLGSPVLATGFDADRWDYVYLKRPGRKEPQRRHLRLYFDGGRLVEIKGDLKPVAEPQSHVAGDGAESAQG